MRPATRVTALYNATVFATTFNGDLYALSATTGVARKA
jgi:hypothetical protein